MQLYARVFIQILDSSIAEDWRVRHIFEDFFKLASDGIVDMTRQAISRRLNVPIELLNECITKLESPDPQSRDQEFEGRRIERLDEHRDWGWRILNWEKYEGIRNRAQANERVQRHRAKRKRENADQPAEKPPRTGFTKPTLDDCRLYGTEIALPQHEVVRFYDYYEANGWRVGKNPMKDWKAAMRSWHSRWSQDGKSPNRGRLPDSDRPLGPEHDLSQAIIGVTRKV